MSTRLRAGLAAAIACVTLLATVAVTATANADTARYRPPKHDVNTSWHTWRNEFFAHGSHSLGHGLCVEWEIDGTFAVKAQMKYIVGVQTESWKDAKVTSPLMQVWTANRCPTSETDPVRYVNVSQIKLTGTVVAANQVSCGWEPGFGASLPFGVFLTDTHTCEHSRAARSLVDNHDPSGRLHTEVISAQGPVVTWHHAQTWHSQYYHDFNHPFCIAFGLAYQVTRKHHESVDGLAGRSGITRCYNVFAAR